LPLSLIKFPEIYENIFKLFTNVCPNIMSKEKSIDQFENVPIPKAIVEKIKKRIEQTDFDSVSSYITYVLQEVLSEENDEEEAVFSKEDEARVKERLKALGYLD